MITVKNRLQNTFIENTGWLTNKQLNSLKKTVYHTFRVYIIPYISISPLKKFFSLDQGRPSKDLQSMVGLFILQHLYDLSDEQTIENYCYSDASQYLMIFLKIYYRNLNSIIIFNALTLQL